MTIGKITKWLGDRGFGFITSEAHPSDIFLHCSSLWTEPGEMPAVGMTVEYQAVAGRDGREKAINARIVRDGEPYIQRPGERRVYQTRQLRAERPVEFEPSALTRDRERHRDLRTRRDSGAAERARIWSHPGADGL